MLFHFKNSVAVLVALGITLTENNSIQFLPILANDFAATKLFLMAVAPRSELQSRGILKESPKITEKQFKFLLNKESQRHLIHKPTSQCTEIYSRESLALCHSGDFLSVFLWTTSKISPF